MAGDPYLESVKNYKDGYAVDIIRNEMLFGTLLSRGVSRSGDLRRWKKVDLAS